MLIVIQISVIFHPSNFGLIYISYLYRIFSILHPGGILLFACSNVGNRVEQMLRDNTIEKSTICLYSYLHSLRY
jgi:hypothetical protein